MIQRFYLFILFGIISHICLVGQNIPTIDMPAIHIVPPPANGPLHMRATASIKLTNGFSYGYTSSNPNGLLNLSISSNPSFVSSAYLGSGSNMQTADCQTYPTPTSLSPVGETPGTFGVSSSGAATYNIPIVISPGTKGVQPNLSINYNSQAGLGIIGTGWSLSGLSSIQRTNKTPLYDGAFNGIQLSTSDLFSLDGNRLFALSGTYGHNGTTYYTENESFSTITSINTSGNGPEKFEIKDKSGNTLLYGNANNSSCKGVGDNSVLNWYLNEVKDEFGNYMKYYYTQLSGEVVIDRIEYTGNTAASLSPYNTIKFEYIPLAEKTSYYINGVEFKRTQLLKTIRVFSGTQLVKDYILEYKWNNGTYLSFVKEVDATGNELLPTIFCWGNPTYNTGLSDSQSTTIFSNPTDFDNLSSIGADFDGDGFSDYLCINERVGTSSIAGRFRIMHNDFKSNIGTSNTLNFSTYYDNPITLSDESYVLANSVIDENMDNKQEVITVVSDSYGYLSGSVLGGPNPVSKSYLILKTYLDGNGSAVVDNLGGYTTDSAFKLLRNPPQFVATYEDLNGDAITDVLIIDPEHIDVKYNSPTVHYTYPLTANSIARPFLFNSDNLTDYIILENATAAAVNVTILHFNGSALTPLYTTSIGFPSNTLAFSSLQNIGMGDVNGDGIDDLVYITSARDEMFIRKGTGTGFLPAVQINAFVPISVSYHMNINVVDVNGDGKADIVVTNSDNPSNNYFTYFSLGDEIIKGGSYSGSWTKSTIESNKHTRVWSGPGKQIVTDFKEDKEVATGNTITNADFNGDGIMDITSFVHGQEQTIVNNVHKVKESITQIRTAMRSMVTIDYANINSEICKNGSQATLVYKKESTTAYADPLYNYKPNLYCVRKTLEQSGFSPQFSTQKKYIYSDALFHKNGRGFLGFEKVKSFDVNTTIGTLTTTEIDLTYYIPLITEVTNGKFVAQSPVNGIVNYALDNTKLITKSINTYNVIQKNTHGRYCMLSANTLKDYLNSTKVETNYTYDTNLSGKPLTKLETYGWSSTLKTIDESYTYILNNGSYKPESQLVTTTQTGETPYERSVNYYYTSAGNLEYTKKDFMVSALSNSILTIHYSDFNSFGDATKTSVSAANISPARNSEVVYDPTGRFIIKEINALGNFKEYTFESLFGNKTSEQGITGLITRYYYDGLGRLAKTVLPTNAQNKVTYTWEQPSNYVYSSVLGMYSITKEFEANGYEKTYHSSKGEVLRTETQDFSGQVLIADNRYNFVAGSSDPVGSLIESTEPHYLSQQKYQITHYSHEPVFYRPAGQSTYSTSANNVFAQTPTGIFNDITYNSPSSTDQVYTPYFIKNTNQTQQYVEEFFNAAGQKTKTHNYSTVGEQNAVYTYASCGQPKTITLTSPNNPGQSIVYSNSYNDFGLKFQSIDPSRGTSSYAYNALSEVLAFSEPTGNFTFVYDVLGRTTSKVGSISGTSTYQYVSTGNGKEMISKVLGPNSTSEYKYDSFNRLTEDKETILSNSKVIKTNYGYDNYGRENLHTYPSGIITKNQYNSLGYLTSVLDNSDNVIWSLVSKDALGRVREFNYGNGINVKHTYGDLNYLSEINYGNGSIHKQVYTYEPLTGNMKTRTFYNYTNSTTLQDKFDFDNLDRLKKSYQYVSSTNTSLDVNNLNYDILGNITHKDDAGDYHYTNTNNPFLLTSINPASSNIDPNTLSVQYNDLRKVSQITQMVSSTLKKMDFIYGTGGDRIKMDYSFGGANQYTRYYGECYDRQETGSNVKEWTYVFAPSGLCAVYFNDNGTTKLNYVVSDHLGNPLLLANTGQAVQEQYSFDSWGRKRNPTDWSFTSVPPFQKMIRGYTMHEHLDEFSLINMNGRVYDPILGRFIQADDRITDESKLQTYNIYAYCENNPLKYSDPTGHTAYPAYTPTYDQMFNHSATLNSYYSNASAAVYVASNAPSGPPIGYSLQGDFLARYNAEYQVINNTQPNYSPAKATYGGGGVITGSPILTSASISQYMMLAAHTGLDFMGLAPGVGEIADAANAGLYAYEGDYLNAGISLGATLPLAGWAATGGKWISRTTDIWTSTSKLSPAENAFAHFQKHRSEFPEFYNAKQYVEGTQSFLLDSPAGTLMKTRSNGDILKYYPQTNTFGVMDAKGTPRTMFKPQDGMQYWLKQ